MTSQRGICFAVLLLLLGILAACQGPPGETGASGPPGAAAAPPTPTDTDAPHVGMMCEIGSAVIGFDADGRIVCAPVGADEPAPVAEATPESDTTPPSISDFDFEPKTVSLSDGPAEITFTARIVDELSGNAPGQANSEGLPGENGASTQARFVSPSGIHFFFVLFHDAQRVSGDARDGVYEYVATIPEYVERGEWALEQLTLADVAGNKEKFNQEQARAEGMPTTFEVR